MIVPGLVCLLALLLLAGAHRLLRATDGASAAIHFELRPINFQLEHGEVAARHVPATMAGGVAIFDYNRDGRPDIFFTNGANLATLQKDDPKYRNRLFRNDGNGVFTDVTEAAGLAGTGFDSGVAVGDYDNDGYPDLFVAGVHHNTLYHNNGNGTFTDVTEKAGISNQPDPKYGPMWGIAAVWVDVNNDGLLDLFVVNYLAWDYATEPLCDYKGVPSRAAAATSSEARSTSAWPPPASSNPSASFIATPAIRATSLLRALSWIRLGNSPTGRRLSRRC